MLIIEHNWPQTLNEYTTILEQCLMAFDRTLPVHRVILFGSHARGESQAQSDVDLCVITGEIPSQHQAVVALRKAIGRLRGKPSLTLIPIAEKRLREKQREHDPFFNTILSEGICVAHQ